MEKDFVNAVVIFVDILGTQARKGFSEWYKIMRLFSEAISFEKELDSYHDWTVYKREISVFSDCAYIVYSYREGISEERKDDNQLQCIACYNTLKLLYSFLKNGFLVRGGFTFGQIYFEDGIWFGPAMNRAYYLESKISKYPRVIIDPIIAGRLDETNEAIYRDTELKRRINGEVIKIDTDGIYYLNYFDMFLRSDDSMSVIENLIKICNKVKEKKYDNSDKQHSIQEKYQWIENHLKDYFEW